MYTQEDVIKVQKRLLDMAVVIRDVLEKYDIPYFLSSGSLIGAVRHGGFIPWDDDIDFYLFEDSYSKALQALSSELPKDMFMEYKDTEPKYFHDWAHVKCNLTIAESELYPQDSCYTHKGLSIDLYKMVKMKRNDWPDFKCKKAIEYLERRLQNGFMTLVEYEGKKKELIEKFEGAKLSNALSNETIFGSSVSKHIFKYNDILPLSKIVFAGEEFKAPHSIDGFLTEIYGDYMKLPPVEKQVPHYSSVIFLC